MLSFDRGGTNLSAVWNEINSIKVDTLSLYTMITAGGGVIPEELLNSITLLTSNTGILSSDITLLNNNTSDFNNELYSLKTDTSTIASDTNALNMDVVSLYNICSSLSDSISTITGGGGGGLPYYLAYSDAIASSLSFVYNMTGDIPSLAYNSVNFYGNINKFADYSIPITINKFTISNVQSISKLSMSNTTTASSLTTLNKISLGAEYFNENKFEKIGNLNISAYNMVSNTFTSMYDLNIIANGISSCTFSVCYQNLYADKISKCSFPYAYGCVNARSLYNNTFYAVNTINADALYSNSFINNDMPEIVANYMANNTFTYNYLTPNIKAGGFNYNSFALNNDCSIFADSIYGNLYQAFSNVSKKVNLLIQGNTISGNKFYSLSDVVLSGFNLNGSNEFFELNNLYFKKFTELLSTSKRPGPNITTTFENGFRNIKLFDVHELEVPITMGAYNIVGVETMKLNYNWNWEFITTMWSLQNIQPTNIYTLDFYKCDNYISNSTFTIPSFYSGYDEGNVWISGKPLSELGYTLSVSA